MLRVERLSLMTSVRTGFVDLCVIVVSAAPRSIHNMYKYRGINHHAGISTRATVFVCMHVRADLNFCIKLN